MHCIFVSLYITVTKNKQKQKQPTKTIVRDERFILAYGFSKFQRHAMVSNSVVPGSSPIRVNQRARQK